MVTQCQRSIGLEACCVVSDTHVHVPSDIIMRFLLAQKVHELGYERLFRGNTLSQHGVVCIFVPSQMHSAHRS